jgi:hypothetical protein
MDAVEDDSSSELVVMTASSTMAMERTAVAAVAIVTTFTPFTPFPTPPPTPTPAPAPRRSSKTSPPEVSDSDEARADAKARICEWDLLRTSEAGTRMGCEGADVVDASRERAGTLTAELPLSSSKCTGIGAVRPIALGGSGPTSPMPRLPEMPTCASLVLRPRVTPSELSRADAEFGRDEDAPARCVGDPKSSKAVGDEKNDMDTFPRPPLPCAPALTCPCP